VVDIIITDGHFDRQFSDDNIKRLNELGHETLLIHVFDPRMMLPTVDYHHGVKHYLKMQSFDELVPKTVKIFSTIKKMLIKKAKVR
jgi:hypothetical protein